MEQWQLTRMTRQRFAALRARLRSRGAVAVMAVLSILVSIGAAGLAVDLGRFYVLKSELQNAADACSLAAAAQLNGEADALSRAEAAGLVVLGRHRVNFQTSAVPSATSSVGSTNGTVTFSAQLDSSFLSKDGGAAAATAKYAMCTVGRDQLNTFFMHAVGINESGLRVFARAAASNIPSQTNCALPMGVCGNAAIPGTYGLTAGQWMISEYGGGSGTPGQYTWLNLGSGKGGSAIQSQVGGVGECATSSSTGTTTSIYSFGGKLSAIQDDWNARFGIYRNGGKTSIADVPPDRTGYAYFNEGKNVYNDFKAKRVTNTPYQGDKAAFGACQNVWDSAKGCGGGFNNSTSTQLDTAGTDRRLMTSPILNCTGANPSILDWACVLMLHPIGSKSSVVKLEYIGLASAANSPCRSMGVPGSSSGKGPRVPALVQ